MGQGTLGMEGVGAPDVDAARPATLDLAAAPEDDEQVADVSSSVRCSAGAVE